MPMQSEVRVYSPPRWPLTQWLADPGPEVPENIRGALVGYLFASLPVFAGGVFNTLLVSAVVAFRKPSAPFLIWLGLEITICVARGGVGAGVTG